VKTVNWRNLIVTDSEGDTWGTLGQLVHLAPANLDSARTATLGNGTLCIHEWPNFFISAEGEEPDWDTPKDDVDWSGFRESLAEARGNA